MARDLVSGEVIAWSWTVTEVEKMAAAAATRHERHADWLPWESRRTCARDGILDCLYSARTKPTPLELASAAHDGINAEIHAIQRSYGIFHSTGRAFSALWIGTIRCYAAGFMDDWADRHAIREVWDQMREQDREPVRALIETGDYDSAARSLGITKQVYQRRLAKARRHARELWFWPETAPRQWGNDYPGRDRRYGVMRAFRNKHAWREKAAAGD